MTRLGFAAAGLLALAAARGSAEPPDYPIRPVPFTRVRLDGGFWARRAEINRTVTIPFIFGKNRETGRVDNFAFAGRLKQGQFKGQRYNDTDVYKALEGASYSLALHKDAALEKLVDDVIATVAAAQEPDGYLFTPRSVDPGNPPPGIGDTRWSNLPVSHELYNAGHLYEAAVAHFEATGKRTLFDVALRNADLVAATFGPGKRSGFPGHQEIELGLVKLYRSSGNPRYLGLARYFLDQRGRDVALTQYPPGSRFAIYNDPVQIQAHKPVLEQDEAVGHAVRAMYMYAGMADVAALTGDDAYLGAIQRLWRNVVGRKLYLTGGVGARHDREAFGADYELPNLHAYNETCAAIGNVFWNHRMFLLTGDGRYLDVMERVLYNGLISGVSLAGDGFFYPNPLASDGRFEFNKGLLGRAPWFDVACCPGNVCRFIPSLPGYVYATRGGELFANLFVGSATRVAVGGIDVAIRQRTMYPLDGAVRIEVDPERAAEFSLNLRIPGWARGEAVPEGLYRYLAAADTGVSLLVNGRSVPLAMERGFARLRRTWRKGDVAELILPMPVRRVVAHEALVEDAGKTALERGPLVYCLEWPDNPGDVFDLALADGATLETEPRPDLLGGVVVVKGKATDARPFVAIPYYAWAHRGPGKMTVWINRKPGS